MAEVRRYYHGALEAPIADFVDRITGVALEGDIHRLRPGLQREQLFDDPPRVQSVILLDHDYRQMPQLALERIPDDYQINDRHQDDRDQRDRVARELLQITAHDCEELESEHRFSWSTLALLRHPGAHQQADSFCRLGAERSAGVVDEHILKPQVLNCAPGD